MGHAEGVPCLPLRRVPRSGRHWETAALLLPLPLSSQQPPSAPLVPSSAAAVAIIPPPSFFLLRPPHPGVAIGLPLAAVPLSPPPCRVY